MSQWRNQGTGGKRNFEKEVLPMGSTEEVEEKSGDKTPPKKCEKVTEDQKKKKIARQREGWRMVWEGGGDTTPIYSENVRKKKTPKRRRITTKNKEEGRNKEESSSGFFLQRWLSGTTKQTQEGLEKESHIRNLKKKMKLEEVNKNEGEKDDKVANKNKKRSLHERIKWFEKEETNESKPSKKFRQDESWIGHGLGMGCNKDRNSSRKNDGKGELDYGDETHEKDDGYSQPRHSEPWDGRGEKSGPMGSFMDDQELRKKGTGEKFGVYAWKGERETNGKYKANKPQPTHNSDVKKIKSIIGSIGTPKGILSGHKELIGEEIDKRLLKDQ